MNYLYDFMEGFVRGMEEYHKKTFSIYIRCRHQFMTDSMKVLLNDPDQFLYNPQTHIIQNNFKSTLGIVAMDGRKIVIKRHNYKSVWHRLRRYFRPTRAAKNWAMSEILLDNHIWVPLPVAYVETRIGLLRGKSFFIYEYVEGIMGEEYFKQNINTPDRVEQGIDLVLELIKQIKKIGFIHGDIRMSNLIFKDDRICLLDLDDIKPITWYQVNRVKTRDVRGLKKDIVYNIPPALQVRFFERLEEL